MRIIITLLGCTALLAGCSTSTANRADGQSSQGNKFAVGLGLGTTGATVEAKFAPNDIVGVRGSFNFLTGDGELEDDGIIYEGDINASTFGGFVDLAPFKNGFVISGGAYLGDKSFDLNATPNVNVQIGDQTFTPSEVGTLTGQAEGKSFAPYAGLGYDGFIAGSKDWSFNARAGVMFTGSPNFELSSVNGSLSSNAQLRQELDAEISQLEDDAEDFKYYPVLTLGVARRF